MTLVRSIRIQGCGKEFYSNTKVDLSEPTTIGQHANYPLSYCYKNELPWTVVLGTKIVGETTSQGVKIANVSLTCYATDCPDNVNYVKPLLVHSEQK